MEHLSLFAKPSTGMNLTKVAHACEKNQQWKELTFLQIKDKEFDKAVNTIINHSVDAWDHIQFKEVCQSVQCLIYPFDEICFLTRFHFPR